MLLVLLSLVLESMRVEGKDFAIDVSHPPSSVQYSVCIQDTGLSCRFRIMSIPTILRQSEEMTVFETRIINASEIN